MNAKLAVELTLRGFQAFSSGLHALGGGIASIGKGVSLANTALAHLGQNFNQVVSLVKGAGRIGEGLIGPNAELETMTKQYEALTGSAELAAQAVKLVVGGTVAGKLPFQVGEVDAAAKSLIAFGIGVGGVIKNLDDITDPAERMYQAFRAAHSTAPNLQGVLGAVGDVAAMSGNDIDALAKKVGQFYYLTQQDLPFKEMLKEAFGSTGALSDDAKKQLIAMSEAGGQGAQAWALLLQEFGRHSGKAAEMGQTFAGLGIVAKNQFRELRGEVGKPLFEAMRKDLQQVISLMGGMGENAKMGDLTQTLGQGLADVYAQVRDAGVQFGQTLITAAGDGKLGEVLRQQAAGAFVQVGVWVGNGILQVSGEIGRQVAAAIRAEIFGGPLPKTGSVFLPSGTVPGAGQNNATQQSPWQREQATHTAEITSNLERAATHSRQIATSWADMAAAGARM